MEKTHISTAFDEDLEAIQRMVMRMGGLVETQILDASKALKKRDLDIAAHVIELDHDVDGLEEEIDHAVVRIIALRQPQAGDLRRVIAVMKIAGNLERVGDYAKNIAKRTAQVIETPPVGDAAGALRRMAKAVNGMLADALDAYLRDDAELSEDVRQRDEDIDQMHNSLLREFLTHMMEDPRNISAALHLLFIAKNLERMGDHITNVAEQTIYLVTGHMPGEDRPKRTAFTDTGGGTDAAGAGRDGSAG